MQLKSGLETDYIKATHISDDPAGYAQGSIDYAVAWADKMESAIDNGETLDQCAERTSHEADTEGITGNMYGWAVRILSTYWIHGDALKLWHNTKYGCPGAKGVINPAVISIYVPGETK